jgi:predicted enzyme related to lactoylglutathione lyase
MPYWLVTTGPDGQPGINGGLVPRQGEIDGQAVIAYVCTVDVESVDDLVATVEKNGGQVVVPKMPIPGMGWLVYCKDTEGNIFGMMQNDPEAK